MKDNTWLWIVGIIVTIILFTKGGDLMATLESRIPQDIFYEWQTKLVDEGTKYLPDGMNYLEVKKIEVSITGCGEEIGEAYLNNELIGTYSFQDCEFLTYPDGTGDAYTHYQTKTFTKLFYGTPTSPKLDSNKITYRFTRVDGDITKKQMLVYEKVECVTSSQCVGAAPYCDAKQHICLPKVTVCTTEWDPVCGINDISYGNSCFAALVGTSVKHKGLCEGDSIEDVDEKEKIDFEIITEPLIKFNTTAIIIGIIIFLIIIILVSRKK